MHYIIKADLLTDIKLDAELSILDFLNMADVFRKQKARNYLAGGLWMSQTHTELHVHFEAQGVVR